MLNLQCSQQTDCLIEWQSPKIVLPRLYNKKVGSLPSYKDLKSGGDYSRTKGIQSTLSEDNEVEFIRAIDFPKVSAKSWLVYNKQFKFVIKSHMARSKRQIASLTKIMTCHCILQLCKKYDIALKETYFREEIKSIDLTEDQDHISIYLEYFMEYMNGVARKLGLRNTNFTNPHGLDYRNNYSCCKDILKLTLICFQNEIIQRICATKEHRAEVRIYRNKIMYKKGITWKNTNKLLGIVGYRGLKTGYTTKAGGCLSSVFETNRFPGNDCTLVVIVLGSKTQDHRFVDTSRLIQYATEEMKLLLK